MAIVTMKRLRLLAMRENREALLDDLQRLGCVEVSEPTLDGREEESGAVELLSHLTPPDAQALSQAQTRRQEAERAMGILKHYGAKGRGFLTPRPQTSKEELCSPQAAARQDQAVAGVLAEERQVNALLAQGEKLASQRAALAPWLALGRSPGEPVYPKSAGAVRHPHRRPAPLRRRRVRSRRPVSSRSSGRPAPGGSCGTACWCAM